MNWLENKYTYLAGGRCRNFKRISDSVYQFSCPICGDSKRHPRKARGYITSKGGNVWYTCHKACGSMPFHRFIQRVDPAMYADYLKERVTSGLWSPTARVRPALVAPAPVVQSVSNEHATTRGDPLSPLLRVDTLKPSHKARVLCEHRKIPDLTKLYHCPKFYAWTNYALKREKFSKNALFYDHARLIIPFIRDGKLIAFQGRDYNPDSDNKYVTIRINEDQRAIYGLDEIDYGATRYAMEGPIDSMFVPNSIAFAGGDHSTVSKDFVIVYDNEPRSPHTVKKISHAIRDGYQVCIWPTHVVQKDVNDMVMAGIDPKPIIDSRIFSGLSAQLELAVWRR